MTRYRFGMQWSTADITLEQYLRWLGYLDYIAKEGLLKRMLFKELRRRLCHRPIKEEMKGYIAIGLARDWSAG